MSKIVSNKNQLARMVEIMEANPDFAKGIWPKPLINKKWSEITVELNSLGPPERDSIKWQRVWADLKCKTKKKQTKNKIEIVSTGGGPNNQQRLTETEEAVSALMHFDSIVDPPGTEFGLECASNEDVIPIDLQQEAALSSVKEKTQTHKVMKERNDIHRLKLLESQTSAQEEYYTSMVDIMSSVHENISNINKCVSNISYYAKKSFDLKKEKNEEILKLKKEKLQIQREKLELKKKTSRTGTE